MIKRIDKQLDKANTQHYKRRLKELKMIRST